MLKEVPPDSTVVGVPGRVVKREGTGVVDLEHNKLPDPVAEIILNLQRRMEELEQKLVERELENRE